jgi:hypothetical protein
VALLLNDKGDGTTILSSFGGQALNANSIILSYQLIGDLDFDGDLDADDYARMDGGFASHAVNYQNGDLDYSGGPANADDYFLLDRAFVEQFVSGKSGATGLASTRRRIPRLGTLDRPTGPPEGASRTRKVSRITVKGHARKGPPQWRHRWKLARPFRFLT